MTTVLTAAESETLRALALEEFARRDLVEFGKRVFPGFMAPRHVELMADHLERLERGEIRRLLVAVSVRHGKSVLCSQVFPAWFLGRNPTKEVVLASYASDLAERNSRIAKSLIESTEWPFYDVQLALDSKAIARWHLGQGGGCRAIGVGSGITGHGADVLAIDDPHATASSDADREAAWTWYQETITPRLNAGAKVILVSARFHDGDLAGRILENEPAGTWTVLQLPAICEDENDPLGRSIGEALWPEHMSVAEIESRRAAMGSAAWSAQFQMQPVPAGGRMFERAWLEHRYDRLPIDNAPELKALTYLGWQEVGVRRAPWFLAQGIDSAWRTGSRNDPSCIVTAGTDGRNFYIVDVRNDRWEYSDLRDAVVQSFEWFRPQMLAVEEAASGFALVSDLRKWTGIPVKAITPEKSKEVRASLIAPLFECGRVLLPRNAPWVGPFIDEFLRFPGGRHDDRVDATGLVLTLLREVHARANIRPLNIDWKSR